MPYFEVTLITRALSKTDLYKVLHRAATTLLDHGAIIEKMESLGYRDLPYKRISKQNKEPVYTSNLFLMKTYMSLEAKKKTRSILRNDLDMVHVEMVSEAEMTTPPFECNLEELLKPPSERLVVFSVL
ncbi:unnamed protein product [Toxocara canis]|uniref:Small ribosomal subunit protein bS6m n=1 Tax=Toxocara canis TaxID=6265 RepID=A0A183U407_TOXCA|nr:unnamed protein product [Toxocara canis]